MHIYWQGISCVKIQVGDSVCILNPFDDAVGLTMPKLRADVVISTNVSDKRSNNISRLQGEPFMVSTPGEFEVKGIHVRGVARNENDIFFLLKVEGVTFAHLGNTCFEPTQEQLAILEGVDVLFLPLACEEQVSASKVAGLIEPRVIIPIAFSAAKEKIALPTLSAFAKEMGMKSTDAEEKIIIKQKDLPQEETHIHVLSIA